VKCIIEFEIKGGGDVWDEIVRDVYLDDIVRDICLDDIVRDIWEDIVDEIYRVRDTGWRRCLG